MKFAIMADVHANLEALQAVLADARQQQCTHHAFLGDIVGFCADPRPCIATVRAMGTPCVKGNYDEYCASDMPLDDFNPAAAKAVQWIRKQLTSEDRQWLLGLPYVRMVEGFTIVHATLNDPERWQYAFDKLAAAGSFPYQTTRIAAGGV